MKDIVTKICFVFSVFITIGGSASAATISTSTIAGGSLAGQTLSNTEWTITVLPGSEISGNVLINNYNAHRAGAVVPFGYTWSWGARETSIVTIDSWISTRTSNYDVSINLTAPETLGTYYLLFGHRGEFNLSQVFSATNWQRRRIVWNDGNDYHDMDDSTLQFAHDNGYVQDWSYLFSSGYRDVNLAVLPIKINVSAVLTSNAVPSPNTGWLIVFGFLSLVYVNGINLHKRSHSTSLFRLKN